MINLVKYVVKSYIVKPNSKILKMNAEKNYADEVMEICMPIDEYFKDENSKKEWARKIEQRALIGFYNADVEIK